MCVVEKHQLSSLTCISLHRFRRKVVTPGSISHPCAAAGSTAPHAFPVKSCTTATNPTPPAPVASKVFSEGGGDDGC